MTTNVISNALLRLQVKEVSKRRIEGKERKGDRKKQKKND